MLEKITVWILPFCVGGILFYGLLKNVSVYDAMIAGAKKGMQTCASVLPPVLVMLTAVKMVSASGLVEEISRLAAPLLSKAGFPQECIPLAIIRPLSFGGSLSCYMDIAENMMGSHAERTAAVILATGESGFYIASLYSGALGIKKSRRMMAVILFTAFACYFLAAFFTRT